MNELDKAVKIAIDMLRGSGNDSFLDINRKQANQLADFLNDVLFGISCDLAYKNVARSRDERGE